MQKNQPNKEQPPKFDPEQISNEICQYINQFRTNPQSLIEKLEVRSSSFKGTAFADSTGKYFQTYEGKDEVVKTLEATKTMAKTKTLKRSRGLDKAAAELGSYLSKSGELSHIGKNYSQVTNRISKQGNAYGEIGELIGAQAQTGLDYVLHWVIGDGDEQKEDRSTLLNPKFTKVGIFCDVHSNFDYCAVIVLAQEFATFNPDQSYVEGENANPIINKTIRDHLPEDIRNL